MGTNATKNETNLSCPLLDRFLNESRGNMDTVYIVNCAINAVFSCSAVVANAVIIATILRSPSLRSPTFYFIFGLAVSDFAVGLLAQPLYVVYKMAGLYGNSKLNCAAGVSFVLVSTQLSGVSFLTMTLISLDRYLALHLHLRYNEFLTLYRVNIALVCTWILTAFANVMWIASLKAYYLIASTGFALFLITTLLSYVMIFRIVRRHRQKIQQQNIAVLQLNSACSQGVNSVQDNSTSQQTTNSENQKRLAAMGYKASAKSMFVVYLIFLLCVLPFMCVLLVSSVLGRSTEVETAFNFTMTLVFINSTVNPFVYCKLMKDLRKEVCKKLGSVSGYLGRE